MYRAEAGAPPGEGRDVWRTCGRERRAEGVREGGRVREEGLWRGCRRERRVEGVGGRDVWRVCGREECRSRAMLHVRVAEESLGVWEGRVWECV